MEIHHELIRDAIDSISDMMGPVVADQVSEIRAYISACESALRPKTQFCAGCEASAREIVGLKLTLVQIVEFAGKGNGDDRNIIAQMSMIAFQALCASREEKNG